MKVSKRDQCFGGTYVRYFVYTPAGQVTRRAAFVCSALSDAHSWSGVCRQLTLLGVLCVVIELPGFGTTPVKAPQDNVTRARLFWGVLDEVERARGEAHCAWHLVAHGGACGAIMEMAHSEPESVLSRAMISPVTGRFASPPASWLLTNGIGRRLLRLWYGYMTGDTGRFNKKLTALYGMPMPDKRMEQLRREFVRRGRVNTLTDMFGRGYFIQDKACLVPGAVLLICGHTDKVFGPRLGEKFARLMPKAEIERHDIANCAHMAMETHPEDVSDYLSGWFDFIEGGKKQPKRV